VVYVIVLALALVVVFVVTEPLRRSRIAGSPPRDEGPTPEVIELEAARDAKYREIRDAELDHQTGKLSDADWGAIDSALRAEAVEILRELDRASERATRER
jgi:hypothetical protein